MTGIFISALISLILTSLGYLVNLISYRTNGTVPLAHAVYGGEITVHTGFGFQLTHIYSMLPEGSDTISVKFDPVSFLICFLVIFIIVWLVLKLISFLKKGRSDR